MSRRLVLVAGLVALCLSIVVAASVAATGGRDGAGAQKAPLVAPKTLKSPGALAHRVGRSARRAQRRQLKRLATPKARAARERSRTAFAKQTDAEALATAKDEFPNAVNGADDAAPIRKADRAVRYFRKDHAAVVVSGDKEAKGPGKRRRRLVVSTLPLRTKDAEGDVAPISTDIVRTASGDLRPENALTDVRVDADLRKGIHFDRADAGLRPTGIDLGAPTEVRDGRAFWANVAHDTDFMVTMRPTGVETFNLLRSQQAPEKLSFDVEVPEGGSIGLDPDFKGIEVKDRDGHTVMRVAPPMAGDADGRLVPSRWVVHGTVAELEVDHRSADVHYPVLVDPVVVVDQLFWNSDSSIDFGGWGWNESNWGSLAKLAGTSAWGRGLNIWLPPNLTPPAGMWGLYYLKAPGDTFVSRFEAGDLTFYPAGGRSCVTLGILGSWSPITWNPAQVSVAGYTDASPWGRCAYQQPTGFANSYQVHSLQGSNWSTVTRGNMAAVQWWAPAAQGGGAIDEIFLGGAYVEITDDQGPVSFFQSGLPGGWTSNPSVSFSTYASDNGFGMSYMRADLDDVKIAEQELNCNPDPQHGVLCPAQQRLDINQTLSNGIHSYDVFGADAVDNGWWGGAYTARIDTVAPKVQLTNSAYELRGLEVGESSYPLDVQAYDDPADPNDAITATSGIASNELLVDGAVAQTATQGCGQGCLDGDSAGLNSAFTFNTDNYSDGAHTLQVRTRDRAGNTTLSPTWTLTVVSGSVTNPRPGLRASRRLTLEAHARRPGLTSVSWQWRKPAAGSTPATAWATIPVSALRDAGGTQPGSTSAGLTNGDSAPLSWNVTATPGLTNQTQALEVRGVFSGGAGGTTNASRVTFDTKGVDGRTATDQIGPGAVNLLTGNFAVRSEDVSIKAGLAMLGFTRSYNSRDTATTGIVGPGWTVSNPVIEQGADVARIDEPAGAGYVELVMGDGTSVPFSYVSSGLRPATGYEFYTLTKSSDTYTLKDETDGSSVLLRAQPGVSGVYYPEVVKQAATAASSTAVFETPSGGATRIKTLYAPAPPGVDCAASFVTGCRSLEFIYSATSTATSQVEGGWGDYAGRLSHVNFKGYDPATSSITIEAVENYQYDSAGRLRAAWDPRVTPALKTKYTYDATGLMVSMTPAGEQPWTMAYAPQGTEPEPGRLTQVSRSGALGAATWTVAYDIPVSGAGAPMDLSPGAVAAWGQSDIATDATAVFPPDQVPALPTTDYSRAEVHYLNRDGYQVNDLMPGGGLSTSERDRYGNVVRDLTATNRAKALADASPLTRSRELDTQRTYSSDGLDLLNEIGPLHSVRLISNATANARRHVQYRYDETKPAGSGPYHLPTTKIVSAQIAGQADAEARTTVLDYDWAVRRPSKQVTSYGVLNLTTTMQYDAATGLMTSRRQPRSPTTDAASTTQYVVYTAAANSSYPACGSHPEWYGLPCAEKPAVQPGTAGLPTLPTTTFQYNKEGLVTLETNSGSSVRTTTTTYDDAGRITGTAIANGAGTAVPAATTTYDAATGRIATQSATINGTPRTVQMGYDGLGQATSYTDSTGQTSTTTYDLLGRVASVDDGKGTQTYNYDPTTGRLMSMTDSQAGTFGATYDTDGRMLTKSLPNGLKATYKLDETGAPYDLEYVKTTSCASDCTWLHFGLTRSVHGQERSLDSTMSQQTMTYDGAGRLTEVRDTPVSGGCTVRQYQYDADGNRVKQTTHAPGSGGACDPASTGTSVTHAYDAADRLTDAGIAYDAFGRVTTLPGASAGGLKLTSTYFADDRTRTQTQGGKTITYDLDPTRRIMQRTVGSEVETSHYLDGGDSPSWTSTGSHWSRNVPGIDGNLAATVDDAAGTILQLENLHGDVAATAATSSTKLNDVQVLSAQRTGSSWSVDPIRSLVPGAYVAKVTQNDASGNFGTAATHFKVGSVGKPDRIYRDTVLADEPSSYWRVGETAGTVGQNAANASKPLTYQNGVLLNQPGAMAGDPDKAISLDGVDDIATAPDQPWRTSVGGEFTAEAWVKTTQRGTAIMSQGALSDAVAWWARIDSTTAHLGQVQAFFKRGSRSVSAYSTKRVDDGRWHHVAIAVTRDLTARVMVDGVSSQATAPASTLYPTYAYGFDEGTGATVASQGTAGNSTGTINYATWTRQGRFGGALNFAGSYSSVQVPDGPGLRANTALTVEAWVKPSGFSVYGGVVSKTDGPYSSTPAWGLTSLYQMPMATVGSASVTGGSLSQNAWTHMAFTWDAATTTLRTYVNGTLANTSTSASAPVDSGGSLRIGGFGNYQWNGLIDEVRIYQRVLGQSDIVTDMNAPVEETARTAPTAALGMDDGAGQTIADKSGNGRDVTLAGSFPGWTTGRFGTGIQLNGANYGALVDQGLAAPASGLTLSAWIRTSGLSTVPAIGQTTFGLFGATATGVGPGVCVSTTSCLTAPNTANGIWTHLTATWDKFNLRLYVNGVLSGTLATTAAALSGGILPIGRDTVHSQTAFASGAIDEVRVYARPLSAAEVTREWNLSIAQVPGGSDPYITLGKSALGSTYYAGLIDEPAVYPRLLSDEQLAEHYRARSLSTVLDAPSITAPADAATVADATPSFAGTGLDTETVAPNLKVDVFNGTNVSGTPAQSLLAPRGPSGTWGVESVKGLPAGSYTAKVTQSDGSGRYGTATRAFSVAGAADPETTYRASVLSDTPVGYWRLGESSGTSADDETSGNHDGQYKYGVALGHGGALGDDADKSAGFDGSDDVADMGDAGDAFDAGTGDYAAEAWIKTTAANGQAVLSKGDAWHLNVANDAGHEGQLRFGTFDGTKAVVGYSTQRVDDGAWHHVAVSADRDTDITLYVDGAPTVVSDTAPAALANATQLLVGAYGSSPRFAGDIDEVAVYAHTLSAARVGVHYRLGVSADGTAPPVTVTSPADGSGNVSATTGFAGTAGAATSDASALTVTVSPDPSAGPIEMYDYDEFGVPRDTGATHRYGWLGAKRRGTELSSGVIAMGARSYVPSLGRFLQVDPIDGGSANPYDYVFQDPYNVFDFDGMCGFSWKCAKQKARNIARRAQRYARQAARSTILSPRVKQVAADAAKFAGRNVSAIAKTMYTGTKETFKMAPIPYLGCNVFKSAIDKDNSFKDSFKDAYDCTTLPILLDND